MRAPLLIDEARRGVRGTLCRCGASKNKPFCDGSHAEVALLATGAPPKVPLSARDGPVQVRPQRNGPLDVEGNVEILSGTGRAIARLTEARRCRCGHPETKIFCDGSHA